MPVRNTERREMSLIHAPLLRDETVPAGRQHGPGAFFENLDPCSWIGESQELKRGQRAGDAEAPSLPQLPGEPDADTALALFLGELRETSGADFGGDGDDRHRDGSLPHPDAGLAHRDRRGPRQTASSPIGVGTFPIGIGEIPIKIGRVPSGRGCPSSRWAALPPGSETSPSSSEPSPSGSEGPHLERDDPHPDREPAKRRGRAVRRSLRCSLKTTQNTQ
jgi:hypothetical protein